MRQLPPNKLLQTGAAKRLMAECVPAPYGKGTATLVNTRVPNAFELRSKAFTLTNPHWDKALQQLLPAIAKAFGLPGDRLQARLYKLLLYGAKAPLTQKCWDRIADAIPLDKR